MKAVLENKGIEGKTNFFQNGLFFLSFGTIDDNTKWLYSFCGYKKPFFFSDHSSGKRFRQNDDVPIVNLQRFFRRNPPTSWWMKKKIECSKQEKSSWRKKPVMLFSKFFLVLSKQKKSKSLWSAGLWTKILVVFTT